MAGYQRLTQNLRLWGIIFVIIGTLQVGIDTINMVQTPATSVVVSPELLLLIAGVFALFIRESLTFSVLAITSLFAGLPETFAVGLGDFSSILNLLVFLILISQFFSSNMLKQRYMAAGGQQIEIIAEQYASLVSVAWGVIAGLFYMGYLLAGGITVIASLVFIAAVLALAFGVAALLANVPQLILSVVGSLLGAGFLAAWVMIVTATGSSYPLM